MIRLQLNGSWPTWGRSLFFALALAFATGVGCGKAPILDAKALDSQIEESWMANRKMVDAIPFLERGGHYENHGDKAEVPVDRPHVLPLLKRIRDELALKPVAILEGPDLAMAILVEIPKDPAQRKRLRDMMQPADDAFPGLLMDNWGQKWLSLDFLDEQEVAALNSSGTLDLLQKELESQRQAGN